jgi:hypothetical protein
MVELLYNRVKHDQMGGAQQPLRSDLLVIVFLGQFFYFFLAL